MLVKTRAIVLHRFPYSDSSLIVKALTEESGIVSFILKGAKRKDSPFKGALDPLALSEVVYRESPQKSASADGGLLFVKEAALISWRENLRSDLMSQAIAQVMAEIVLKYAPQGVPLQEEFALLNASLDELNQPSPRPDIFARWLLNTSDLWGYHLDLTSCSRCERPLSESAADFHPETGGLICKACLGVETPRARPETLRGLWMLRHAHGAGDFPSCESLSGDFLSGESPSSDILSDKSPSGEPQPDFASSHAFVENALLAYLRNHIGFLRELKSLQFLTDTRKLFSGN